MGVGALSTAASASIKPGGGGEVAVCTSSRKNCFSGSENAVVSRRRRSRSFSGQIVHLPQEQFRAGGTCCIIVGNSASPVRPASLAVQECYGGSTSASPTLRVAAALRSVVQNHPDEEDGVAARSAPGSPTSASAIAAAAVASVSSAPFGFLTKVGSSDDILSPPSAEFLALCAEQFSLTEKILGGGGKFSVYMRTASSYATRQMEFFRAASYPDTENWNVGSSDTEMLVVSDEPENQSGATGILESAIVQREAVEVPELSAVVLPLLKDMFLVGFLILERQMEKKPTQATKPRKLLRPMKPSWPPRDPRGVITAPDSSYDAKEEEEAEAKAAVGALSKRQHQDLRRFTNEERGALIKISRTLALACVMDQRSVLLQQASWQRGVHVDHLVNEVRGPLMAVRTLGKMLLPHLKRGEISRDVVEDILVQGDRMNDVVKQMQKVLYRTNTGSSSLEYQEDVLRKQNNFSSALSSGDVPVEELRRLPDESSTSAEVDGYARRRSAAIGERTSSSLLMRSTAGRDEEAPMPPVALAAPPQEDMRLCDVSEILYQLVRAGSSLALQKKQDLRLLSSPSDAPLVAAIDSSSLRQALSNLLEFSIQHTPSGGWITAEAKLAPGGGVLVVIEDNGPDIGRVVQERLLAPLGSALSFSRVGSTNDGSVEVASRLIAARDVLEQSSAVLNVKSPCLINAPVDAGGTHIEIWLPVYVAAARKEAAHGEAEELEVEHEDVRVPPSVQRQ